MNGKKRWMVIAWLLLVAGTTSLLALGDNQEPTDKKDPASTAAQDPQAAQETAPQAPRETGPQAEPQSLDGAKVYAWNCGACHSERYPRERKDAAWDKIATHMRVRANLTADQTAAVLHYLKENN